MVVYQYLPAAGQALQRVVVVVVVVGTVYGSLNTQPWFMLGMYPYQYFSRY